MEITQPQERIGCGAGQDRPSSLFPNWTQSSANYVASGWEGLWVLGCEVCWFSVLPRAAIPLRPWLPRTSTPHSFVFNKSSVQRGMWTRAAPPFRFPVHLQPLSFFWNVLPRLFPQAPFSPMFYRCPWPWVAHSTVYIVKLRNKDMRLAAASGVSPPGKLTGFLLRDGWLYRVRHLSTLNRFISWGLLRLRHSSTILISSLKTINDKGIENGHVATVGMGRVGWIEKVALTYIHDRG